MQTQLQETLYLIVAGRLSLASQVLVIDKLPTTVGRSIHCDITLNDPTIAPVQFIRPLPVTIRPNFRVKR